jgi:hypothetical protein
MTDVRNIATARLDLIPATASLLRAETEDPHLFFRLLGVRFVDDWPP